MATDDRSFNGEVVPSLLICTISLELEITFVFLTGDLKMGFVRGFELPNEFTGSFDLSVEISEPLVAPPEVESSAPLLKAMELFIAVVAFYDDFWFDFGGFAAEPEFVVGFLLRRGCSSRCSSLRLDPMLIISTLFDSPFLRSSWIPLRVAFEKICESLKPESFKFGGVSLVI